MDSFFKYLLKIIGAVSGALLSIVGIVVLLYGGLESLHAIEGIIQHPEKDMENISSILHSVDLIFLGIVIQLLSIGLFELFVHELKKLPAWLLVNDFDKLKLIIVKTSITLVTISFAGKAVTWDGQENIMGYGIGIGAIIAALSYFISVKKQGGKS